MGLPASPIIPTVPGAARWKAMRELATTALRDMRNEMESYANDRAETWRQSERGEAFRQRIVAIEQLISELEGLG